MTDFQKTYDAVSKAKAEALDLQKELLKKHEYMLETDKEINILRYEILSQQIHEVNESIASLENILSRIHHAEKIPLEIRGSLQ